MMFLPIIAALLLQTHQTPIYKICGVVSAPVAISQAEPPGSLCAPRTSTRGCPHYALRFVVDANGIPQNVEVTASDGTPEQQQVAVNLVRGYRFKPGQRKGEPVAVAMALEININPF